MSSSLFDIDHVYGNDLKVSQTGDLASVNGAQKGLQRVLRRLLTAIQGYLWHPEYGAGIPGFIGIPLSQLVFDKIRNLIFSNMFMEECVAKTPVPVIDLQVIQGGLSCQINYTDVPSNQPQVLTFNIDI